MFTSVGIFLTNTLQLPEAWSLSSDAEKFVSLGLKPWDYVGEGAGARSNISGLRAMLMGLDDNGHHIDANNDDAALERVLALSMLEHQNNGNNGSEGTGGGNGSVSGSQRTVSNRENKGRDKDKLKSVPDTGADITGNIAGGVEIGMTVDRQEDIQKAIYNMFNGTASGPTGASGGTGGGVASGSPSTIQDTRIETEPVLTYDAISLAVPNSTESSAIVDTSISSISTNAIQTQTQSQSHPSHKMPENLAGFELINDTDAQAGTGAEEGTISNENVDGISCTQCTLINAPTLKFCLACNQPLCLIPMK